MIIKENLLPEKSLNRPCHKLRSKTAVVIHYVGNPNTSPSANINFWRNRKDYGSAHVVIGIDGSIEQAIPFDEVAYHAGTSGVTKIGSLTTPNNFNDHSVGIELCHVAWTSGYSKETLETLDEVLRELKQQGFEYLLIHGEVTGKACDYWFRNNRDELDLLAVRHGYKRP